MRFSSFLAATGLLYRVADAHGGVMSYRIGGKAYPGSPNGRVSANSIQRSWASIDPLRDMNAVSLRCNTPGQTAVQSASVAAGSNITANWQSWPHTHGPIIVWLAKCPGKCQEFDGSGPVWFKIDEAGLLSGTLKNGQWGVTKMMSSGYSWTSTIPASLADGGYLLRHEIISLHDTSKPQFYPECAHITVTGGSGRLPPESALVSIPGLYNRSQASLNINLYSSQAGQTTWAPIGPEVWKG